MEERLKNKKMQIETQPASKNTEMLAALRTEQPSPTVV
jgi:hypothetical protein